MNTSSLQGRLRRRLCRSLNSYTDCDGFQLSHKLASNSTELDISRSYVSRRVYLSHRLHQDVSAQTRLQQHPRSRRGFHSEVHARTLDHVHAEISLSSPEEVPLIDRESFRFKAETRPICCSNDAVGAVENSTGTDIQSTSLPHETCNPKDDRPEIVQFLSKSRHPAQAEWESLWYHGVTSAFRDIAHHFPELENRALQKTTEQSISEPTLDISSLKKEEQKVFRREEQHSKSSFTPKSEVERLRRLEQAQKTSDQREKLALLLGLPTFAAYTETKYIYDNRAAKDPLQPSKRQVKRETRFAQKKEYKQLQQVQNTRSTNVVAKTNCHSSAKLISGMTHQSHQATSSSSIPISGAEHRPLVVGLTKPQSTRSVNTMASSSDATALNKEIAENVKENTTAAAPAEDNTSVPSSSKPKKEKAPKQPKPQKAAAPTAPTSPALIDLRVGHILRAIAHPNADSLYVSTIAMGDAEGTEHTQVDEATGKIVRTVCSGLNGLVPLEEMQDRKIIVVANLKPVNMRSIKSAAMVLAASPKQPEGADPHAPDRVVELVQPPEGAQAGDKVYFEGWSYGEGKGPEKVLNPKKKQWEAIQPGFYTSEDLVVAFDAGQCEEVDGSEKGNLVVEGKGVCTVKTLKGAVVR